MKNLLLIFLVLTLAACLDDSDSGGGNKPVDPVVFELAQVQSVNEWYLTVSAYDPSVQQNLNFLFDYTEASITYEHPSCSNHPAPNGADLASGSYVDIIGDLNDVDKDTGAIKARTIFVHNPVCLEIAGVILIQPERTVPR